MIDNDVKEFVKKLNFTNGKYGSRKIFTDVVTLAVCIIQFGMLKNDTYKKQYDTILSSYTDKEQTELQILVLELTGLYYKQKEPVDIMTHIFGELGLGNKETGQFFTPTPVSDLMANIVGNEIDVTAIKEKGYISLHEPTSGAGGMILSFARQLQDKGYNPSKNLLVVAWDIDILCTNMTYLQMCMYDIPAVVTNGDTLALKENFTIYTPQYYIFNKLLQDGKLNTPICTYCGREIQGEVKKSELRFNSEVCTDCHRTENMLSALKKLVG